MSGTDVVEVMRRELNKAVEALVSIRDAWAENPEDVDLREAYLAQAKIVREAEADFWYVEAAFSGTE